MPADGTLPTVSPGPQDWQGFAALCSYYQHFGFVLRWVTVFGSNPRLYRGVFKRPSRPFEAGWNIQGEQTDVGYTNKVLQGYARGFVREDLIAICHDQTFATIHRDDSLGEISTVMTFDLATLKKYLPQYASQGLIPYRIQAGGSATDARFTAIFTERDVPLPREIGAPRSSVRGGVRSPADGDARSRWQRFALGGARPRQGRWSEAGEVQETGHSSDGC